MLPLPNSVAASLRFGVRTTLPKRASSSRRTERAAESASSPPRLAVKTGSTTAGSHGRALSDATTARTAAGVGRAPTRTAFAESQGSVASCAASTSSGIVCRAMTPRPSCALTAAIALKTRTPNCAPTVISRPVPAMFHGWLVPIESTIMTRSIATPKRARPASVEPPARLPR